MVVWDGRCVDARGSNRVHNQAKLSSTYCSESHRGPTLTQQYLKKEEPESRQSTLQEWKHCHSVLPISPASELNTYITPLPYSATLVAFYLLATMSKNLKLKALSIMSFPVSSRTVVVATMESKSLGKDIGGYTNNGKGKKIV